MRRRIVGVILLAGVGLTTISAQQGQSVPGFGSGEVTVKGVVGISNTVPVTQSGSWKVAVDGSPEVRVANQPIVWIAPPSFIKAGGRLAITWNAGDTENVTVSAVGGGGWIQVNTSNTPIRWINVTLARAIETR